eukprot:7713_1
MLLVIILVIYQIHATSVPEKLDYFKYIAWNQRGQYHRTLQSFQHEVMTPRIVLTSHTVILAVLDACKLSRDTQFAAKVWDYAITSDTCSLQPTQMLYSKMLAVYGSAMRTGRYSLSMGDLNNVINITNSWIYQYQHNKKTLQSEIKLPVDEPVILNQIMKIIWHLSSGKIPWKTKLNKLKKYLSIMITLQITPDNSTLLILKKSKLYHVISPENCIDLVELSKHLNIANFVIKNLLLKVISPKNLDDFDSENEYRISSHLKKLRHCVEMSTVLSTVLQNCPEYNEQDRYGLTIALFQENVIHKQIPLSNYLFIEVLLDACAKLKNVQWATTIWHYYFQNNSSLKPTQLLYSKYLNIMDITCHRMWMYYKSAKVLLYEWMMQFVTDKLSLHIQNISNEPIILHQFMNTVAFGLNDIARDFKRKVIFTCFTVIIEGNVEPNQETATIMKHPIVELTANDCVKFIKKANSEKMVDWIMDKLLYTFISPDKFHEFDKMHNQSISKRLLRLCYKDFSQTIQNIPNLL